MPASHTLSSQAEQRTLVRKPTQAPLAGYGVSGTRHERAAVYYALEMVPYALGSRQHGHPAPADAAAGGVRGADGASDLPVPARSCPARRGLRPSARCASRCSRCSRRCPPPSARMRCCHVAGVAAFLCIARAFRRGFPAPGARVRGGDRDRIRDEAQLRRDGLGVFVGLVALAVRESRAERWREHCSHRRSRRASEVAPVVPLRSEIASTSHPTLGSSREPPGAACSRLGVRRAQLHVAVVLPRMPGHDSILHGDDDDTRTSGSTARWGCTAGWTRFPTWVDNVTLIPAARVALLCADSPAGAGKRRLLEFGVYIALALWIVVMLGVSSYRSDALTDGRVRRAALSAAAPVAARRCGGDGGTRSRASVDGRGRRGADRAVSRARMFLAIDAAFCSVERVTIAGSMTPAATRSTISLVAAFRPLPAFALRTSLTTTELSSPAFSAI